MMSASRIDRVPVVNNEGVPLDDVYSQENTNISICESSAVIDAALEMYKQFDAADRSSYLDYQSLEKTPSEADFSWEAFKNVQRPIL